MTKPTEPGFRRQHQSAMDEGQRRQEFVDAYKQGVFETAQNNVIFIDSDALRKAGYGQRTRLNIPTLGQQLRRQIESETDTFAAKIVTPNIVESLTDYAKALKSSGPAASYTPTMVNGNAYHLVNLPPKQIDTKEEITTSFLPFLTKHERHVILNNLPGTGAEWARMIGIHEGVHVNQDRPFLKSDMLDRETKADRAVVETMLSEGREDLAQAWQDMRALSRFVQNDLAEHLKETKIGHSHSTASFIFSGADITDLDHATANNNLGQRMDRIVKKHLEKNDDSLSVTISAAELLSKDPGKFFDIVREKLEHKASSAANGHAKHPTDYLRTQNALEKQITLNQFNAFEGAYRRLLLSEDLPPNQNRYIHIVSQDFTTRFPEIEDDMQRLIGSAMLDIVEAHENSPERKAFDVTNLDHVYARISELDDMKYALECAHEESPSHQTLGKLIELQYTIDSDYRLMNKHHTLDDLPGDRFIPPKVVDFEQVKQYYFEMALQNYNSASPENIGPSNDASSPHVNSRP